MSIFIKPRDTESLKSVKSCLETRVFNTAKPELVFQLRGTTMVPKDADFCSEEQSQDAAHLTAGPALKVGHRKTGNRNPTVM